MRPSMRQELREMYQTMTRRRFVAGLGAVATMGLAALASGCADYPSTQDALKAQAKSSQLPAGSTIVSDVLTVGVNTSNAPYCWPTSDGQRLQGVDVDVALALGAQLGVEVRFVNVGATYNGAAGGTCDVVMGVTTATLPGSEVLVGNYAESAPAVFARDFSGSLSDADLEGATVGVQSDSSSARAAQQAAPGVQLSPFSTLNDAFDSLESGGVSYVACDSFMGGYLAMGYDDIDFAAAFSLAQARGVAVGATDAQLADALTSAFDALTSSGELAAIRSRWVGDMATVSSSNQLVVTGVAQSYADAQAAQDASAADAAASDQQGVGDESLGYYDDSGAWVWY